jgi:beta-lactamase superfamily II metal-dependent hydrolase
MLLKSYKAGKGESFLLQWEYDGTEHTALIDTGISNTYRFIKEDLRNSQRLDFIVITHVDYDHLGGALKLLNDQEISLSGPYYFFLNTPSLILAPKTGDMVNIEHGIKLDQILNEKGIEVKGLYCAPENDSPIKLHGLEITILSPTRIILDELIEKWTADALCEKYMEESKGSDKVSRSFLEKESYEKILSRKEEIPSWKADLINSSSIAFLLAYNGCSILFLGDSNPTIVYEELRRKGYSENNKLKVSLVKISHHGSCHNSTSDLFSILNCTHYFISTNGSGNSYHPDRETIVRLAEYGRENVKQHLTIYLNYDLDRRRFITPEEEEQWNLRFECREIVDFREWLCYRKN